MSAVSGYLTNISRGIGLDDTVEMMRRSRQERENKEQETLAQKGINDVFHVNFKNFRFFSVGRI